MWGSVRVSWTGAASPCEGLNVIRVRNPDAIDASPIAEQFNGLTLKHHFLPAHRENADPVDVFLACPGPGCQRPSSDGSAFSERPEVLVEQPTAYLAVVVLAHAVLSQVKC